MKEKLNLLALFPLIIITMWLRLVNLGYSDYMGDEIKALARLAPGQSLANFLLEQRKGPVEFLATYLIGLFHPSFANRFFTRLPFALVGIIGVFIFYRLIKMHYGGRPALYATLLMATNGIFIGLNRIVQYQPFTILFSLLALYVFSLAIERERWQIVGVYAGMIFWAIAVLAHYDGVFIAPIVVYLLYRWYTCSSSLPPGTRRWHLALST
jgi:4-amino-4-deoxy-L-arabinose transferase-like glycosyltransferase